MKKKALNVRLNLARKTLRPLGEPELGHAAGGTVHSDCYCRTDNCDTRIRACGPSRWDC